MYGYLSDLLAKKGRHVYTISPEATVQVAVHTMDEYGVGALVVTQGRDPVGIFTERDVLRRVVEAPRDPARTLVLEVMTPNPISLAPAAPVEDAISIMTTQNFRHLPVVDDGRIVGLISSGDIMRWIGASQEVHIKQLTEYITGAVTG